VLNDEFVAGHNGLVPAYLYCSSIFFNAWTPDVPVLMCSKFWKLIFRKKM